MGRKEQRKKDKDTRKKAKAMLTDAQLERVRTATINQEVADRLSKTWDKLSDHFIVSMRKNKIGQERTNTIIKEFAAAVLAAREEELKHE